MKTADKNSSRTPPNSEQRLYEITKMIKNRETESNSKKTVEKKKTITLREESIPPVIIIPRPELNKKLNYDHSDTGIKHTSNHNLSQKSKNSRRCSFEENPKIKNLGLEELKSHFMDEDNEKIKIENEENEPISICEAFILKALSKKVISEHLIKLFGYDPNGLKRNYILVYSDANKFEPLWKRYLSYIEMVDYPFVLKGAPRDLSHKYSPYSEIKVGLAYHSRSGGLVEVLHIFVNMNHQIN